MSSNEQSEFEFETRTSFKRKSVKNNHSEENKSQGITNQVTNRPKNSFSNTNKI